MKAGIYVNRNKDKNLSVTKKLIKALLDAGIQPVLNEDLKSEFEGLPFFSAENIKETDIIAVIGGDGTILGIAVNAARHNIPLLCINLGTVGFLSEVETDFIEQAIAAIKKKQYTIEKRAIIQADAGGKSFYALNEFVLRSRDFNMLKFEVFVDDVFVDSYNADGFLVSTPTGSTAYSLSAGGPILSPNIKGFVLTSICSHSLRNRPLVISDEDTVRVKADKPLSNICLVADGAIAASFKNCAEVMLSKAPVQAEFIRLKSEQFYSKLLSKLNKWQS